MSCGYRLIFICQVFYSNPNATFVFEKVYENLRCKMHFNIFHGKFTLTYAGLHFKTNCDILVHFACKRLIFKLFVKEKCILWQQITSEGREVVGLSLPQYFM